MWVAFLLGGPNSTILRCTETTHPQEERISFLQVSQDRLVRFLPASMLPKRRSVIAARLPMSFTPLHVGAQSSAPPSPPTFGDNAASVCPSVGSERPRDVDCFRRPKSVHPDATLLIAIAIALCCCCRCCSDKAGDGSAARNTHREQRTPRKRQNMSFITNGPATCWRFQ